MGETRVSVKLVGAREEMSARGAGRHRVYKHRPTADLAQKIGVELVGGLEVDTAAGPAEAKLGSALIQLESGAARVPVMALPGLPPPIIGLATLEALGFKVNPPRKSWRLRGQRL